MYNIKIKIKRENFTYKVIIGEGILASLYNFINNLGLGDSTYIITNSILRKKYESLLRDAFKNIEIKFKNVPVGEKAKSSKYVFDIIGNLNKFAKRRRIFLTAFGGGVISDLTGFIASIYKRGIPYINIPTTLLAQVDAAIGGKTAIDLPSAKNIIGTFYHPTIVISDISLIKSLNIRDLRNGLTEVIKHALIRDREFFYYLEKNYSRVLNKDVSVLKYIVNKSILIKSRIIEKDEKEKKGIRTLLNFGHTLGHAIETASKYQKYSHGEAIALGIILENDLSNKLGFLNIDLKKRIEELFLSIGLPTKIKGLSLKEILDAYHYDKKFKGKKNRFVLIKNIASPFIIENVSSRIIEEIIKKRLE